MKSFTELQKIAKRSASLNESGATSYHHHLQAYPWPIAGAYPPPSASVLPESNAIRNMVLKGLMSGKKPAAVYEFLAHRYPGYESYIQEVMGIFVQDVPAPSSNPAISEAGKYESEGGFFKWALGLLTKMAFGRAVTTIPEIAKMYVQKNVGPKNRDQVTHILTKLLTSKSDSIDGLTSTNMDADDKHNLLMRGNKRKRDLNPMKVNRRVVTGNF